MSLFPEFFVFIGSEMSFWPSTVCPSSPSLCPLDPDPELTVCPSFPQADSPSSPPPTRPSCSCPAQLCRSCRTARISCGRWCCSTWCRGSSGWTTWPTTTSWALPRPEDASWGSTSSSRAPTTRCVFSLGGGGFLYYTGNSSLMRTCFLNTSLIHINHPGITDVIQLQQS